MYPVSITENIREIFQATKDFISTEEKIKYINSAMRVGFDIIEIGSNVSKKILLQFSDIIEVLNGIDKSSKTEIRVLVSNEKYAKEIIEHENVDSISYPMSISDEFLKRNLRTTYDNALEELLKLMFITERHNKKLGIYISFAFGSPYSGELTNNSKIMERLISITDLSLRHKNTYIIFADTLGGTSINKMRKILIDYFYEYPFQNIHLHMHSEKSEMNARIRSMFVFRNIVNFESTMFGRGGCLFTGKKEIKNIDTLILKGDVISSVDFMNETARLYIKYK